MGGKKGHWVGFFHLQPKGLDFMVILAQGFTKGGSLILIRAYYQGKN